MEKRKDTVENAQIDWESFTSLEIERQLELVQIVLLQRLEENQAALSRLSRMGVSESDEERPAKRQYTKRGKGVTTISDADLKPYDNGAE
jgi:hypothetical protein